MHMHLFGPWRACTSAVPSPELMILVSCGAHAAGARAGVTPTGAFVNSTAGAQYVAASGMW